MTFQRRRVGSAGEEAALIYLKEKGYTIERVNYRSPLGEIDIVARENTAVIFIEVRTRTGVRKGTPAESITAHKGRRLKKLALYYLQKQYGREMPCRIDLIAVDMDRDELKPLSLKHYRGILSH